METLPAVVEDVSMYTGLSEENRELITLGQVVVWPGRDPAKPVLRWATDNVRRGKPGSVVLGSGVSPRHVDADNGRKGGFKNSTAWLELLQRRLDADDGGGFEAVIEGMFTAAVGGIKIEQHECSECGTVDEIEFSTPPDPRAGKILMEFLVPKPTQRTETDVHMTVIQAKLSELIDISAEDIASHELTDEEIETRRRIVEAVDTDGGTN
jgi:hypothetical protein